MYFIERVCVWFSAETVLFGDGAKINTQQSFAAKEKNDFLRLEWGLFSSSIML